MFGCREKGGKRKERERERGREERERDPMATTFPLQKNREKIN
jgi:hypothetical protein